MATIVPVIYTSILTPTPKEEKKNQLNQIAIQHPYFLLITPMFTKNFSPILRQFYF